MSMRDLTSMQGQGGTKEHSGQGRTSTSETLGAALPAWLCRRVSSTPSVLRSAWSISSPRAVGGRGVAASVASATSSVMLGTRLMESSASDCAESARERAPVAEWERWRCGEGGAGTAGMRRGTFGGRVGLPLGAAAAAVDARGILPGELKGKGALGGRAVEGGGGGGSFATAAAAAGGPSMNADGSRGGDVAWWGALKAAGAASPLPLARRADGRAAAPPVPAPSGAGGAGRAGDTMGTHGDGARASALPAAASRGVGGSASASRVALSSERLARRSLLIVASAGSMPSPNVLCTPLSVRGRPAAPPDAHVAADSSEAVPFSGAAPPPRVPAAAALAAASPPFSSAARRCASAAIAVSMLGMSMVLPPVRYCSAAGLAASRGVGCGSSSPRPVS